MDLFAKRISKSMWCLLGIILFIILFSLISPYLAPNDPYLTHSDNILAAPDMNHLFGTDNHGRDVLSRVMVGSRSSIFAAFAIIACAGTLGSFVGLMGGYFGGKTDACLMRVTDVFLAFPDILLAIAVAGILGGSLLNAMFALVLTAWTQYARLARSSTIAIKEETFIHAARLGGCSDREIIFLHILPNIAGPLIVTATPCKRYDDGARRAVISRTRGAGTGSGVGVHDQRRTLLSSECAVGGSRTECRHGFRYACF